MQQRLSADRHFETYYRDNKYQAFYESLVVEKNTRIAELSRQHGVQDQLKRLVMKKDGFVDEVVRAGEEIGSLMQALLAIEDLRVVIESLCTKYFNLELDKKELVECLKYILKDDSSGLFEQKKYKFLPVDFKKQKENAVFLKEQHDLTGIFDDLCAAF